MDDLLIQGLDVDGSSYKKLSSGKYACLVCPHNPILDSPLMLSWICLPIGLYCLDAKVSLHTIGFRVVKCCFSQVHSIGSRHLAAESRLKKKESVRKDEINKRLALSDSPVGSFDSTNLNSKG
ncbi:hypothetical protein GH714_008243 [Hevea brasiliensis]|uniref:Sodium channel modifier 1 zinc-finger domain-containing protein n=1 Tax=Hevea brasiliensis TaxID=3981 RepID=A0A6A6LXU1_HEVBR|nr:hypothetical protein GH714_008197 [Hevea brasiliensis]KAF2305814.1 hypothetical protein GH714_008243 [Hevea brasiliensis]